MVAFSFEFSLLLLLFCASSRTAVVSARIIQFVKEETSSDDLHCDGWRLSAETNNAGHWSVVPSECADFVGVYMMGDHYLVDSEVVTMESLSFAQTVKIAGDRMDAWVFDVDETLLSNLAYYKLHGFGSERFNATLWDVWVERGQATALPASLKLYNEIKKLGFAIILLTGRDESQRNLTEKNLRKEHYNGWTKLIMRGHEDAGKPATLYKSQKRSALVDQGFRIQGSSGDQWSDLLGFAVAQRSFKVPNPMYHIK